jgi:hypothetical protein
VGAIRPWKVRRPPGPQPSMPQGASAESNRSCSSVLSKGTRGGPFPFKYPGPLIWHQSPTHASLPTPGSWWRGFPSAGDHGPRQATANARCCVHRDKGLAAGDLEPLRLSAAPFGCAVSRAPFELSCCLPHFRTRRGAGRGRWSSQQ